MTFAHRLMPVYKDAMLFVKWANTVVRPALNRGNGPLGDQLARAASSIALNIAEGAGRFSIGEKVRFYQIALGSTTECDAILDVIVTSESSKLAPEHFEVELQRLQTIALGLTSLIRSMEQRER